MPARSTCLVGQRRPARHRQARELLPTRSPRAARQPRGAHAAGPRAAPGDGGARRGPPGLRRLALGQGARARAPRSTRRPSSGCAASRSACARTCAGTGVGVSIVSPGFDPRRRDVRRLGRKAPPGLGTTHAGAGRRAPWCGRSSATSVEIAVAPVRQRALAHIGMCAPGLAVPRRGRGAATEGRGRGRRGTGGQAVRRFDRR